MGSNPTCVSFLSLFKSGGEVALIRIYSSNIDSFKLKSEVARIEVVSLTHEALKS